MAPHYTWKSTLFRFSPLAGLFALALATCCVGVSWFLERRLSGSPVADWPDDSAHSFISDTATVCNAMVRFAFGQGLPLYWWRKAMLGNSIGRLHRQWRVGRGFLDAIRTPRGFGLIFMATIFTTLLPADNPLLQRALTTSRYKPQEQGNVTLWMPRQLPPGSSGQIGPWEGEFDASWDLEQAYDTFMTAQNLTMFSEGCQGICTVAIEGPGLYPYGCRNTSTAVDVNHLTEWPRFQPDHGVLFDVSFHEQYLIRGPWFGPEEPPPNIGMAEADRESVAVTVSRAELNDGLGELVTTQCWLSAATLQYELSVNQNGTLSFLTDLSRLRVLGLADNTQPGKLGERSPSTITTAIEYARPYLESHVSYTGRLTDVSREGFFGQQMVINQTFRDFSARDPLDGIISTLNTLFFILGSQVADNAYTDVRETYAQTVNARLIVPDLFYSTSLLFWGLATVIQLIAILLVACFYWKYWQLGRKVSLSPFEIAKAFDAPLFRTANTNSDANELVEQTGRLQIRYGTVSQEALLPTSESKSGISIVQNGTHPQRLIFAEHDHVTAPEKNQVFTV